MILNLIKKLWIGAALLASRSTGATTTHGLDSIIPKLTVYSVDENTFQICLFMIKNTAQVGLNAFRIEDLEIKGNFQQALENINTDYGCELTPPVGIRDNNINEISQCLHKASTNPHVVFSTLVTGNQKEEIEHCQKQLQKSLAENSNSNSPSRIVISRT